MKREENQIDKTFHDAAMQYGVEPPAHAWDRIAGGLDAQARLRRIVWYRRTAVAASILLAFFVGYYFPSKQPLIAPTVETVRPFSRIVPSAPTVLLNENENTSVEPQTLNNSYASNQYTTIYEHPNNTATVKTETSTIELVQGRSANNLFHTWIESNAISHQSAQLIAFAHPVGATEKGSGDNNRGIVWSIGGEASPMYAYRDIVSQPADNGFVAQSAAVDLNAEEKPLLSYSTGLTAAAAFNDRWSLQTGLLYSRQGQNTNDFRVSTRYGSSARSYTSAGVVVFNQEGNDLIESKSVYFDGQSMSGIDLIQQFDYLELPLVGRYKIVDRKVDISAFAGFSTGLLVGNNVLLDNGDGSKTKVGYTYGAKKSIFNSLAGIGVDIPLTKRLDFSLAPGLRYALAPINDLSAIEHRPYSFTLNTSINFEF